MASSDVLPGKQIVVRMQYDDSISVTQRHLDQVLSSIDQSLKNSKVNRILAQFDVTLGARVNSVPTTDQGEATKGQHIITGSNVNGPGLNGPHKTVGGCGLTSLVSSPTENYTFYAKTAMRTPSPDARLSTILVEVFVNQEVSDKDTRGVVISAVTQAIESCIIKQPENSGANVKICVLNFLSSACAKSGSC